MTKEETKEKSKALPVHIKGNWTAFPNNVLRYYFFHPRFKWVHCVLYLYLLDKYNAKEGYAWPTQDTMADELATTRVTIRSAIQVLEELDLLHKDKHPEYGNHIYVPLNPVRTIEELEAKFPEVMEFRRKHFEQRDADREARGRDVSEFRKKLAGIHAEGKN